MGTKSPSCRPSAAAEDVRITDGPLDLAAAVARAADTRTGGVVTFSGNVRDSEGGEPIRAIRYEVYESMARKEIAKLLVEAHRRWGVRAVVEHRVGEVPAGESSIIIVCAGEHREEAFAACRWMLEEIKAHAPIWKVKFEQGGAA
ncbi:MAG: molybdenum cofactor biosynthesis protein MoaE [Elusimicrobiota bacterium]